MKNREFRTLLAIIALSGTLLTGVTAATTPVYAADVNSKTTTSEVTTGAKPYKDETVYATIDGNGNVKEVTVSDQLKNISDSKSVADQSNLQNIENVKGNETFSVDGKNLTWNPENADICYQGTTTETLPVSVRVTYTLDGKQVKAEELEGKSGHLVIRYDYENHSGAGSTGKTPFLMATGLVLDSEVFKNVEVTNGRIMSDGEKDVAIGIALPSFKEMLGTEELDIPEYFEVDADVTNYKQAQGMTVATNSFFNDLDADTFDSLSDLEGSMNELQDASNQLVDGSGELRKGLDTLLASSGTMKDGIKKLAVGSATLADGTQTLKNGASELSNGLNTAASKVSSELLPGMKQLNQGIAQMETRFSEGLPKLADGVTRLNDGIGQVADGTKVLSGGIGQIADGTHALSGGIVQVADGTKALSGGIHQVSENMTKLSAGLNQAGQGASALKNGVEILAQKTPELVAGVSNVAEGSQALAGAVSQVKDGMQAMSEVKDTTTNAEEIETLTALLNSGEVEGTVAATIQEVIHSLTVDQETRSGMAGQVASKQQELIGAMEQLSTKTAGLAAGAATLSDGMSQVGAQFQKGTEGGQPTLLDGVEALYAVLNPETGEITRGAAALDLALNTGNETTPALKTAAEKISTAMNEGEGTTPAIKAAAEQLDVALNTGNEKTPSVKSAIARLDAALNEGDVAQNIPSIRGAMGTLQESVNGKDGFTTQAISGVAQLKDGTSRLVAGVDGEKGLACGLNQLNAGAAQLAGGSSELNNGANALANGIGTLSAGSDALIEGVTKLDEGAVKLNDGMIKFDEEGIQKLVNAFSGDIEGVLDKANSMLDNSRSYKNFSGIADGMDGEVKFIFITE